jgi:L-cysteine:1D-myo-inositol 2-amino-2-deoxy-alpha-D-glucopyranoside ligase
MNEPSGGPATILRRMRLYDQMTGGLREVTIRPRMTLYVCGITPYDSAHAGHAFTYVHFDVLVRYLRHRGVEVLHAQNVTDVDDDILRVAGEGNVDYRELAERENTAFVQAMDALGVTRPTFSPWASQFVPDIVEEVEALLGAGRAYQREGTVYFRVTADPEYGKLSRLDREQMLTLAAERGGHPEDPRKEDPLDFVLWQRSEPVEPWWESPWGRGRPGWHIECSTMARRLLGQPVDIHSGGSDLIFPHHESEIAQAESLPGERPFVRHWMHTGAVGYEGEKMSKSLGNLVFVGDLLRRHPPSVIRRYLLSKHYRQDWTFREQELHDTALPEADDQIEPDLMHRDFYAALDEDLDTPAALRVLDRAKSSADPAVKALVEEAAAILGLDLGSTT